MRIRLVSFSLFFASLFVVPLHAADIPQPVYKAPVMIPQLQWSGFYGGVGGGYAWGDPSVDVNPANVALPPSTQALSSFTRGGPFTLYTQPSGGFATILIGYNWQLQNLVFGWEADFSAGDIHDSANGDFVNNAVFDTDVGQTRGAVSLESKLKWFGTLRARLGWSFGNLLPYVTGGLAYGRVTSDVVSSGVQILNGTNAGGYMSAISVSDTLVGYSVGAGFDWILAGQWRLRGEYLYINLPGGDHTITGVPAVTFVSNEMDAHLARVAIIYRLTP